MNKNIANLVALQELALNTVVTRARAGDKQGDAAKAGRMVINNAFNNQRAKAVGRFGARCLLAEAGIVEFDPARGLSMMADYLANMAKQFMPLDAALDSLLITAWGWKIDKEFKRDAFRVKHDDVWVGVSEPEEIVEEARALTADQWFTIGYWEALRWVIENHDGVKALQESEFFVVKDFSSLYRVYRGITWWASYEGKARKTESFLADRVRNAEAEYELSGGCNTHYVGEAIAEYGEYAPKLEQAVEANLMLTNQSVLKLFRDFEVLNDLAGRPPVVRDYYSEAEQVERQLQALETAAIQALEDTRKMLEAAVKNGFIEA